MLTLKAHFDGKVFVPDEPVSLPCGAEANVVVEDREAGVAPANSATPTPRITAVLTGLDPEVARAIGEDPEFNLENA